jgi:PAS domain S-box-containing protein
VLALIALGALLSTTISATLGLSSVFAGELVPRANATEVWRAWWLGDAVGDLVVAPLLLAWCGSRPSPWAARRRAESAVLSASVTAATLSVFLQPAVSTATGFIQACMLIPLLIWGALRFGMRGATAAVFLTSVIAVAGTAFGRGPFVQGSLSSSLLHLQAFMAIVAVAVLILGAVAVERVDALRRSELGAQALRESEGRLRLAVESAQVGIWDLDPISGQLDASPRCKAIFGLPLDTTMTYDAFLGTVHPEDRRRTHELVQLALAQPGRLYDVEYRCIWPDGAMRWIAARGEAHLGEVGGTRRAVHMSGTVLDITERRRAEESLRETDRRRSEFLGVLSHELRNPLAPIRTALHILRSAPEDSDGARRAKGVIERQTNQLTRLVEDLLDVTRISRGKIQLRRHRVELTGLVRRAVEDHRPLFEARGVALSLSTDARPLWIHADAARIAQIIGNLLQNSAKFTNENGHVAVCVERAGPTFAAIRVTDDGVGIDPEVLPSIFEAFTQADDSLHRSPGGLGLGLALVKALVELHGGLVEARSPGPRRGSEFTVSLPFLAEGTATPEAPPAVHRIQTARRRVLVIEDNPDAAEMLGEALAMSDHEVEIARDGEEGLAKARAFKPDVVLCDIGLPGLDGYEVARRIRADPTLSPTLIALTGYALPENQRMALAAGFHQHLAKPFELAALEEVLARVTIKPAAGGALVVNDNDSLRSEPGDGPLPR